MKVIVTKYLYSELTEVQEVELTVPDGIVDVIEYLDNNGLLGDANFEPVEEWSKAYEVQYEYCEV